MSDIPDPRPMLERPEHWRYRACWQLRYQWDERVAMSELGIGPEEAPLNANGRVQFVYLGGRNIDDDKLANLSAFTELGTVYLVRSSVTDGCIPYLLVHPTLNCVWVGETAITEPALRQLERKRPRMLVMRSGESAFQNWRGRWVKNDLLRSWLTWFTGIIARQHEET